MMPNTGPAMLETSGSRSPIEMKYRPCGSFRRAFHRRRPARNDRGANQRQPFTCAHIWCRTARPFTRTGQARVSPSLPQRAALNTIALRERCLVAAV
uniref:Uncharacterized protein n=1 Tax=Cupriavidus taiwanensis TaxID=164546 RepID=A0A375HFL0_9BURK|nr:protein of unknown function [Cupriavidus taiwanensis]